jgi:hypothetical protein
MAPRLVKSLVKFRDQVNALAPKRSTLSDGWIGDAKHSMRKSDHNPEPDGTVDAFDLTHDPKNGVDIQKVADAIVASKDPRVSYLICNGRIVSGSGQKQPAWKWRPYSGANKHTKHLHVSIKDGPQDDTTPWRIEAAFGKAPAPVPATKPASAPTAKQKSAILRRGSKGEFVTELQANLVSLGYGQMKADGVFGPATEKAVKNFQTGAGLKADGWAGPRTMEAIGKALKDRETAPKLAAAEEVVDAAASDGSTVSKTEIVTGITGATGVVAVVKDAVDTAKDGASSLLSLGPWILLGLVLAGGAAFVIYDRRKKRLAARAAQEAMR